MAVDLFHLAHKVTDEEFAKIVISSGDFFPGFYRFNIGNRKEEDGQLTVKGLTSAYFEQISNNKNFSRSDWTSYTKKRHESLDSRNLSRSDSVVYDLLDKSYFSWMIEAKEYDIAVIELNSEVKQINLNETYFFMGSLIRFTENELQIGFDFLRNDTLIKVPVDIDYIIEYTYKIYGNNLRHFFLPADLIASLNFEGETGILSMTDSSFLRTVMSTENNILVASNRDASSHIPIRWAKEIILTEVV